MSLRKIVLLLACTLCIQNAIAQSVEPEKVFEYVEQMPEFPGGDDALYQYLGNNISFPRSAREDSTFTEEIVYINFVVNKKGKITQAYIKKAECKACGLEALRIIKRMPNWKPGKQQGKAVRVYYTLPIQFTKMD